MFGGLKKITYICTVIINQLKIHKMKNNTLLVLAVACLIVMASSLIGFFLVDTNDQLMNLLVLFNVSATIGVGSLFLSKKITKKVW